MWNVTHDLARSVEAFESGKGLYSSRKNLASIAKAANSLHKVLKGL